MSCGCILGSGYDGDGPSASWTHTLCARRTHVCCECKREIAVGELYERDCGVWDGHFSTFKTCADCASIRNEFFCDGFAYGSLWEDFLEHLRDVKGEGVADCLANLTSAAREQVCEHIEELWHED